MERCSRCSLVGDPTSRVSALCRNKPPPHTLPSATLMTHQPSSPISPLPPSAPSTRSQPFTFPFTVIGGSCHKYRFCRDKSMLVLSRQKYACFVATKVCLFCRDKSMLVLSRQKYACFVATKVCLFCRDKSLSSYFCCDKIRVLSLQTRICGEKYVFVATKVLSGQK